MKTIYGLLFGVLGAALVILVIELIGRALAPKEQPQVIIREVVKEEPTRQEPEVLPYWAVYGQPSYWPFYISPYWKYGVANDGPITGGKYRPHGPRPGYTGVSVGGAGGGGHH